MAAVSSPLRLMLVDDAPLVREGIARLLADEGVLVVGQLPDATGLLAAVEASRPGAVIIDVRMPPTHTAEGLEASVELKQEFPDVGVLVLSQYVETRHAVRLLAGAHKGVGYLLKERITRPAELVDAGRRVSEGGTVIDPGVVRIVFETPRRVDPVARLTAKERDVLALVAEGYSNDRIAESLAVTGRTVETHTSRIFIKLGLESDPAIHRRVFGRARPSSRQRLARLTQHRGAHPCWHGRQRDRRGSRYRPDAVPYPGREPNMTFAPIAPTIQVPPLKIAADTYLIQQVQPALGQPLFVYINSMVILGKEPVIVDTGTPANRTQWLADVFSLVEPDDVRWVFLSHDDVDHTGNLEQVMDACPNATLVCNWAMVERHTNCFNFPIDRCRWVMHDESFSVGDRTLHAIRPPVYDSPTTRGLFDPTTGVYWGVDSFATPLPDPHMAIADLDPDFWRFGMTLFSFGALSPWLTIVDHDKFGRSVDDVESLDITTIAGCHTPIIGGPFIKQAFDIVRQLPSVTPPPLPDQSILDQIVAATAQPVA